MKRIIFVLSIISFSFSTFSQGINDYIEKGIAAYDQSDFEGAIKNYKKALEINANSELANYEIALTYFAMQNYKMAIEHGETVVKMNGENLIPAYILVGSALDNSGQTEESIKLFKKAIKKTEGHYLLYYNLGLNYYKIGDRENTQKSILGAIEMNPNHATSHFVLGLIHDELGNKVQSTLAFYYFLLLEPDSNRSSTALSALNENLGKNVEQDPDKPNTINISLNADTDSEFMAAELMLGMLQASAQTEENADKTDDELFESNTESYFTVLGELRDKNSESVWWELYTEVFYEIAQSDYMLTFCKYITQSKNDDSKAWLKENTIAVDNMIERLNDLSKN